MSAEGLNERQKRFCEYYAENPDGTEAAIKAGYSPKSAKSIASENLTKPNILSYIRELWDTAAAPRIASMTEARAILSDVLRDSDAKASDRIRAAELLIRGGGGFSRPVLRQDDDGFTIYGGDDPGPAIIVLPPIEKDPTDEELADEVKDEIKDLKGWTIIK